MTLLLKTKMMNNVDFGRLKFLFSGIALASVPALKVSPYPVYNPVERPPYFERQSINYHFERSSKMQS